MADRKAELEKKRKKLEELKKAREQKKIEAKDKVLKYEYYYVNILHTGYIYYTGNFSNQGFGRGHIRA